MHAHKSPLASRRKRASTRTVVATLPHQTLILLADADADRVLNLDHGTSLSLKQSGK